MEKLNFLNYFKIMGYILVVLASIFCCAESIYCFVSILFIPFQELTLWLLLKPVLFWIASEGFDKLGELIKR